MDTPYCLPIRLAGHGATQCSGRVEVLHNSTWGTVCDTSWDLEDATVVCKQLRCGSALSTPGSTKFGEGTGPIWLHDVACSGGESFVMDCQHGETGQHDCGHDKDAGVVCSGEKTVGFNCCLEMRLVRPEQTTRCSGRVEIYYRNKWGTVCDDDWDLNDANMVCRQLDCGTAVSAPGLAHFGEGTGPIWLDDVSCTGGESSLSECKHNGFDQSDCAHHEDAGVVCSAMYRITHITITNRLDCYHRIRGAEILIGNSPEKNGNNNPRCAIIDSMGAGSTVTFNCGGMIGQFVNVLLRRYDVLTLCEVEVYGEMAAPSYSAVVMGRSIEVVERRLCWSDALFYCRDFYWDLLSIHNHQSDHNRVQFFSSNKP
ncbi:scavenger receptor cysteine-rich domain-containing protein DMBT1-like [Halichoeres trimaculatus]|uniref:scavenger receptor cysteine-rich domain-containing protein DMBT1-like n=1 Tax=Halichoeres trimaculatus TaxID=147232 RepID=UPI003D9E989C